MKQRVILDTDIGTDVDDALALALLLNTPGLHLEGITCVYGDVSLRARIALKLLALAGHPEVPVMIGLSHPLNPEEEIYWEGHEGKGLVDEGDDYVPSDEPAVDFIIRTVLEHPGEIHLIGIGPLTNIAQAIQQEPGLIEAIGHITIMGGAFRGPDWYKLPYAEHNVRCDPEAARIVFASGAPITLVPLDVTSHVQVRQVDCDRIQGVNTPFCQAIAQQLAHYPRFARQGWTNLHDALAVAVVSRPDMVTTRPVHIDVALKGQYSRGMTLMRRPERDEDATVHVAVAVNVPAFEGYFMARLLKSESQ